LTPERIRYSLAVSATVHELLREARGRLRAAPFQPAPREAGLLLGHALGLGEAQVLARDRDSVPEPAARRFHELVERRLGGEPVAYLLGEREFWGRPFRVDSRVLIPRPETEHLIEMALGLDLPAGARVLDIGTGSGCIAVTLALELRGSRVSAVDLSPAALAVAAGNARRLGARVAFSAGDLGEAQRLGAFDLVVSNPPYVDPAEAPRLSPEITRFEPPLALYAEGGAALLTRLLGAATRLRRAAFLLLEIGERQLSLVETLAEASGLEVLESRADLAGIPRSVLLRGRRG
jgi:release factor glutamine methyltransferase